MSVVTLLFEEQVRVDVRGGALPGLPLLMQLFPSTRRIPDPPSGSEPDFEVDGVKARPFTIRTRLPGATTELDPGSADLLKFEDWTDMASRLEVMISRRLLSRQADRVHLHASAALSPEGAILVLGPSGAGKSSLALAWSAAGFPIYGDDVVLVGAGGALEPHRRLIKVDVERLSAHGIDPETTVAFQPESTEIWFDPGGAGGWAASGGVPALVAHATFDPSVVGVKTRPLPPSEVLQRLIASTFPTGLSAAAEMVDRLLGITESSRGVEVTFGSAPQAAAEMAEMLRKFR